MRRRRFAAQVPVGHLRLTRSISPGRPASTSLTTLTRRTAARSGPEQIPAVPSDVGEDCHPAVRLRPRLGHEVDTSAAHPLAAGLEVVDPQEEPDPPGELISYGPLLSVTVSSSEQKPAQGAGWPHDDPPLGVTVAAGGRRVLDELETEEIDEEPDGFVVVVDEESELLEEHARTIAIRTGRTQGFLLGVRPWPDAER
jgi:hypothetical protein